MSIDLSGLLSPDEYRETRERVFGSKGALTWFIRQNREALVAGGALLLVCNRWRVVPEAFDAIVIDIGGQDARREAAAA